LTTTADWAAKQSTNQSINQLIHELIVISSKASIDATTPGLFIEFWAYQAAATDV